MKVCITGHSASGFGEGATGGSEGQSALLARRLAARGHEVTYVVAGLRGGERDADGVRIRSGWDAGAGTRYLRAFRRYQRLLHVLRGEAADVYYSRGAGYYTPFVVRAARDVGAVSVLAIASDRDLYADSGKVLFAVPNAHVSAAIGPVAHAVYRRTGLDAADWVAVQNQEQAAACRRLGLRAAVLPNIVEPPPSGLLGATPGRDALWAGNVGDDRRSKGLAELEALVRLLPEVGFTVAGAFGGETGRAAARDLGRLPNVTLTGRVSRHETMRLMSEHRLIINTSPSEGFSNVMLEGWSLGRPAVTLSVNPSGLLTHDRLGICAHGDLTTMAAAVAALLAEGDARSAMGARCRHYVERSHSPEQVCRIFEALVAR